MICHKTSILRSYLCDHNDTYIVVKGTRDLLAAAANENDKLKKLLSLKDNAPFRSWISKLSVHL